MEPFEDFRTYSTRGRSIQTLVNYDEIVLTDFDFAKQLWFGMIPVLKNEVRLYKSLKVENFDYNVFEGDCDDLYQSLREKGLLTQKPSYTTTRQAVNQPAITAPSPRVSTVDFFWKIHSFLDSKGLCHYCKRQCGSEHGACTGAPDRSRIVFPPNYIAPPKPANYKPPRAKLAINTQAGQPTHPPAGRPSRVSVAATSIPAQSTNPFTALTFPELDSISVAAFAAIDELIKEDNESSDGSHADQDEGTSPKEGCGIRNKSNVKPGSGSP